LAEPPSPTDPSSPAPAKRPPRGLREQFGRTRNALLGLIAAHIDLLSAELSEIVGQVKRVVALAGIAAGFGLFAGLLIFLGTILWFGEWIFGSIGWGVLHGGTGLIAMAVLAGLAIIPNSAPRIGLAVFVALVVAIFTGVVFWLQLTNQFWGWVGTTFFSTISWQGNPISPADRPIVVGAICMGAIFALIGLAYGLYMGRGFGRIGLGIALAIVGAFLGALLGAFLGVPMSWGISIAVAIVVFNVVAPVVAAILIIPEADFDQLRDQFVPSQTIATTKETIEWVRAQMPLGPKS
jgi:hypothetical protein